MFQPSGQSPDKAKIEMSGHILSAQGRGGESGSSSRQLDFKPQTLIPLHFSFSPSSFLFCISLHHPPVPALSIPKAIQYQNLILLHFHRPLECPSLDSRGTGYGADLARSQSLLPLNETLNLTFGFFCPSFLPSTSANALHFLLFQCHTLI